MLLWVPAFAGTNGCYRASTDGDLFDVHQLRLKPALRLFEMSPEAVSLTEPVRR